MFIDDCVLKILTVKILFVQMQHITSADCYPMPAVDKAFSTICLFLCLSVYLSVCLSICAVEGKQLELLTPNSVDP